ncbi:MAG: hypothetical protein CW716_03240 [Candidatus Bathyarchaeum sp.]|nr:MAG: hypothetical protein CW716_03240 [Candidatus Bathyarchaeum sp.]
MSKKYIILISSKRQSADWTEKKAIDVTRDKMKRRAFHLRALIDSVKNKEAKREVIQEYVSLISKMSRNN